MLLAMKEIKREKLRYSLIILLVALISYMMFILSALALGLAHQNMSALDDWNANSIVLNEQAEGVMRASVLTSQQVEDAQKHTDGETAAVGFVSTRFITSSEKKESVNFLGVKKDSFIADRVKLNTGRMPQKSHEVVLDQSVATKAQLAVNDQITLGNDTTLYTVVGIAHDAKLQIAPVAYGLLSDWHRISPLAPNIEASAVVSTKSFSTPESSLSRFTISQFIQLLPGYSAQNKTFVMMIAVLAIVTLVIIAVFLHIIVLQKLPNIAVLKAQGIPTRYLIGSTVEQGSMVVIFGLLIGIILTVATALPMPASVPMEFSPLLLSATAVGLVAMGVIGSLLPAHKIATVDPISLME